MEALLKKYVGKKVTVYFETEHEEGTLVAYDDQFVEIKSEGASIVQMRLVDRKSITRIVYNYKV